MMRHIRSLLITLAVIAALGAAGSLAIYHHYAGDLPDFQQLADYQPKMATRVQAGDGRLLAEYATQKRIFVPISAIPPKLREAVLAAEDRDFYTHPGVDPMAILRAAITNMLHAGSGRRQIGASTITQQVAKNFLLGDEYSYSRKIREAIVAMRMEQVLSKDRIFELYLNEIALGHGAYGIAAAAQAYFNKSLDELTTAECAFLGALPKGPSHYDPVRHYDAAKARRDWVLDGMARTGAISPAEAKLAEAEPITLRKRADMVTVPAPFYTEEVRRELIQRFGETAVYQGGLSVRTSLDSQLQGFADKALRDGLIAYDRKHGFRGPIGHIDLAGWARTLGARRPPLGAAPWSLAVVLDLTSEGAHLGLPDASRGWLPMTEMAWARKELPEQREGPFPRTPSEVLKTGDVILVEAVADAAPHVEQPHRRKTRHHTVEPQEDLPPEPIYALRQIPEVSGALVVLDPHTGRVLALTGGYSYEISQFDRAMQAYRQIGSAIKPIAYLAALDNGMTPSTMILDAPVAIQQGPGLPLWRPANFETDEYRGPTPLRVGIEKSINTMTVRMASIVGIEKIIPYIEKLGIMDKVPAEYSMVLGAGETTPLRLTTAYGMLVNGGKQIVPSLIDRIQDRNGKTIFKHDDRSCPQCGDFGWAPPGEVPHLDDTRAQLINPQTAYQMVNILRGVVERGTAQNSVGKLPYILAGKTGTTNDAKDTWFVGFSPDLVAGVYVGFDQPRGLGYKEQGASVAAPIFAEFMSDALKDKPSIDFRIPPGIHLVRVNPSTGRFADAGERFIWEAFKPESEPSDDEQVIQGGNGVETLSSDDAGLNATGDNSGMPANGNPAGTEPNSVAAVPADPNGGSVQSVPADMGVAQPVPAAPGADGHPPASQPAVGGLY